MSFSLNSIVARVSLDGTGFARGAATIQSQVGILAGKIKGGFAGIVTASIGDIQNAFKGAFMWAEELTNSARSIGVTTTELQMMGKAAKSAGMQEGESMAAITRLARARTEALSNQETRSAFQAFGVSADKLNDKLYTMPELLHDIASAFKKGDLGMELQLSKLMGSSGFMLQGFLDEYKKIHDQPPVNIIDEASVKRMAELNSEYDKLVSKLSFFGKIAAVETVNFVSWMASRNWRGQSKDEREQEDLEKLNRARGVVTGFVRTIREQESGPIGNALKSAVKFLMPGKQTPEGGKIGVDEIALKNKEDIRKATLAADEAEEKLADKKLTRMEREAKMQAEILQLIEDEEMAYYDLGDVLLAEQFRKKRAEKSLELSATQQDFGGERIPIDPWARSGRFAGLSAVSFFTQNSTMREQLEVQKKIEVNTRPVKAPPLVSNL